MKLVNEAVRDIMLYLEQNQVHTLSDNIFEHTVISYTAIADALTSSEYYSIDEVKYAVIQLVYAGLISADMLPGKKGTILRCDFYDIKPDGHEFIDNVRSSTIWQKVKAQAEKEGIFSLTNLAKLCSKTAALIAANTDIPQIALEDVLLHR